MATNKRTVKKSPKQKVLKVIKKPLKVKGSTKCNNVRVSAKSKILIVLEKYFKISKKGVSEFISIDKTMLRKKGFKASEVELFQSNNGVSYLRRESPISRKYLVERKYHQSTGALIGFKLIGFNKTIHFSRHIPQNIRKDVLEKYDNKCIWCGSKDRLEVDHKNGRYNSETNKVSDFQILCKSCNDKKRERCNKCRASGKRYDVQKEISSILYKCPFTQGTCSYGEKLGCKGCFLYDIEDFYTKHDGNVKKPCKSLREIELVVKEVLPRGSKKNVKTFGRVILKQKIVI
jgi:hypothetical protein